MTGRLGGQGDIREGERGLGRDPAGGWGGATGTGRNPTTGWTGRLAGQGGWQNRATGGRRGIRAVGGDVRPVIGQKKVG